MEMDCIKNNEKIVSWLKNNLDEQRYLHTLGTAKCAVELAKKFKLNQKRACIAGLLHDCAKCFRDEDTMKIISKLNLDKNEYCNEKVLHAPVSAYVAQNDFGIEDEEILSSIRWHTLGKRNMTDFEKIIFLADKIEANTRDLDFRETVLRFLEEENGLDKALLICYKQTIKSLLKRDLKICPMTIDIYNDMLE